MRFVSGLGEFELTLDRVEIRGDDYCLVGKMGVWDSETIMSPEELIGLYLKSTRPAVTFYVLKLPFTLIKRKLSGKKQPAAV